MQYAGWIVSYYNIETKPTDDQIISYRNILDGALRVRSVKKGNFATNNIVDIENGKKTNVYKNGYEYDLRFELFNKGETMISSVSEIEISSSADLNLIPLNGKEPEDLFEALTGHRRQIELKTSNYVDNIENCENILDFLGYTKDNSLYRKRTIYRGLGIKFEIDEYFEPESALVLSFEGEK